VGTFGGPGTDLVASDPTSFPQVVRDSDGSVKAPTHDIRHLTDVWSWDYSHSEPATVRNIRSRVLGMSMDYRMPMNVCTEISLQEVSVTLPRVAPKIERPVIPNVSDGLIRSTQHLDNITMAPFCIHDCLHSHVRWGKGTVIFFQAPSELLNIANPLPASARGFDNAFQPYSVKGAPQVPHNQSVNIRLLPPAGFSYEGIANFGINGGQWQVFFHHGMAYANEVWDGGAVNKARTMVEAASNSRQERLFWPLNSSNSFALFYWRLRFGGNVDIRNLLGAPMERVVPGSLAKCMAL
jgi:hypothetical protein